MHRLLTAACAAALLLAPLSACSLTESNSSSSKGGHGTIDVESSDDACDLTSTKAPSGNLVFKVKNTGTELFTGTSYWRGDEADLQRGGDSLAGATLVDPQGKKRYYILRDTDGRCLCTTALSSIGPGQTIPIFMQFPAPPATTTQVDFQLPTLPTASITISG